MNYSNLNKRWSLPEKAIWQLLCHYPDQRSWNMPMAMLNVYIDDSGKEKDSYSQVLAGYLATAEKWAEFSNEWQAILDDVGISDFHMVDAYRLGRDYRHIGVLGRNQLISNLLSCINRHVEMAFVHSIDLRTFRHLFSREKHPEIIEFRPYNIGFHSTLTMISDYVYRKYNNDDLNIFFDEQGGESASRILGAVEHLRDIAKQSKHPMKIPTPQFISDTGLPPLQAADMLAWLCRRENKNYVDLENPKDKAERIWLDQALSMPSEIKLFGIKELSKMTEDIAKSLAKNG
jgi:hypothetical protein